MKSFFTMAVYKRIAVTYITMVAAFFTLVYVAPGSVFLSVQSVEVEDAALGEDVNFTFCRDTTLGAINALGIRTIIKLESGQVVAPKIEYRFPFAIQESGCVPLSLTSPVTGENRQPQIPGEYRFITTVFFEVHGVEKQVTYNSSTYKYGIKE